MSLLKRWTVEKGSKALSQPILVSWIQTHLSKRVPDNTLEKQVSQVGFPCLGFLNTDVRRYKQTNKQTNKHTYIHTYMQTDRQTDRQNIHTDIHTNIHTDTYRYIQIHTDTYR